MTSVISNYGFQSLYNKHRPGVNMCLCSECVRPWQSLDVKEANTKYPDCEECYLYYNHVIGDYMNHYCELHQEQIVPTPDRRKANPDQEFAFTLTMPPDYQPKKPIEEAAKLILTNGLTNNPYEKPCEWAFVMEHTEQGTPHIHGVYKTPSGRRIAAKYFKRYWDLWDEKIKLGQGHKGGYHAQARHTQSYKAYMEKEGVVFKNSPNPDLISHA